MTIEEQIAAAERGDPDPAEIVHIAGLDVKIGRHLRQRCAWCGAVLIDVALDNVARAITEGPPDNDDVPTWAVGKLVGMSADGGIAWEVEHADGETLPTSCCGYLDPTATR